MRHSPCTLSLALKVSRLVFICFGAEYALAAHREISSMSRYNKGLILASSAVPRVWLQISCGHLLQQEHVKLSESGVFFQQLFTSKGTAYNTCKLEGITLAGCEIHIVSSAVVDWFVFLAYRVVIFKLSDTSKLYLNASDSKWACKIQLKHCVSSCICILKMVIEIGVNAIYY